MNLIVFGVVLPWLFVGLGCWIGYLLVRQNGRILLQLETLEQRLAQFPVAPTPALQPAQAPPMPSGLAVGSEAPVFELPALAGGRKSLTGFRGKRLLLIFFNPRCGFCTQMVEELAALPSDGANGRPIPLVVTTGDAEENRKFFAEHGIRCPVLLQKETEVGSRYQAGGTPMGYLIDAEGRIASEMAAGSEALLALVDTPSNTAANGKKTHQGNRALSESRIQRNGLSAGTPAPTFTLPRVDGGELSLEEYRGRKVLLVFSDPNCGPCDALAPQLEQVHRRSGDVQVVMVSRGEVEANRIKVAAHEITFPVVLQRQWEVSKEYAMFATPAGYFVNENGVIAADVATGVEAILSLLSNATNGEPAERRCPCGKVAGECRCAKKNGRAAAAKQRVR